MLTIININYTIIFQISLQLSLNKFVNICYNIHIMKDTFLDTLFNFFSKPILYWPFLISLILNILIWIILLIKVPVSGSGIPLHYNIYFGIDWFGSWVMVFTYPFVGILIIIINFLISLKLQLKEVFLTKLIGFFNILIQLILLLGIATLLLNYFK
jgi:hypothetical protein